MPGGKPTKRLVVVRIRGRVGVRRDVEDTLKMLRLYRKFHATIVDDRESYRGMLQKVKDYVTWGEADEEVIALLLKRRGRVTGGERLTDEYVKSLGFESVEDLARAIAEFKLDLKDVKGLKPYFRLHPPKGGFKRSTKRPYNDGGELGYRGPAIKELIKRMV